MGWLLGLIGLFVGAFLGGGVFRHDISWLSAIVGAVIGVLFGRIATLKQKLAEIESRFDVLNAAISRRGAADLDDERRARAQARAPEPPRATAPVEPVAPPVASKPTEPADDAVEPLALDFTPPPLPPRSGRATFDVGGEPAPSPVLRRETPPQSSRPAAPRPAPASVPHEPDIVERAVDAVRRWFTEGNVPVKIGVLLLFLGVGALMKYAADQGWLTVPIELRLAGIAAGALALLVFAWRKRETHRAFALSLQGGAIGILILVVFGAYKLYGLIPSGAAFALLVVLVAGAGALAVLQDALALAVLGIVGGFLAPILTASDSGNHVALFTYYAVLNAAIFSIAWFKPWRALNLMGFVFTFVIGIAWGTLKYRPELFDTTEPFLILFYASYLAIPVLYAWRRSDNREGIVDGSLVFGTPLIAFPLQAALLEGNRHQLALSAVVLAATHVGVAWFVLRRLSYRLLGHSHALLALGFATLAVPLALSARSTACAWAVEGAALVWLGLRQGRNLPRWIGYALQLAAGASLLIHGIGESAPDGAAAIVNGDFLAIALVAAAGFVSAHLVRDAAPESPSARLLLGWSVLWWIALGANEIARFAPDGTETNWALGFVALSTWLYAELRRGLDWEDLGWPAYAGFLIAPALIAPTLEANGSPLAGWGLAAWIAWFAASLRAQAALAACGAPLLAFIHFAHTWTWVLLLGTQIHKLTAAGADVARIWQALASLLPAAFAFWGTIVRFRPLRFPLGDAAESARTMLLASLSFVLGFAWFGGLFAEGDPRPLPYLPVLNPLELAQIAFVLALLGWYRRAEADGDAILDATTRAQLLAGVAFALLTSITLRGAHFIGGVPWTEAMFSSALAQALLSVVWCLAGLAAMLVGARRGSRAIWIGGATLVGIVIAKLILVDRSHLSDLSAILGVLAVGGLLLVVGWFAPNPPRQAEGAGE
ncbi:DUF2339 domain-containing protein [Tahibacter soli]|uniref:DUF2339 domain-containing protein n=1 Tax=Tahibacter soli TaxID=2983605 RepID=A0A9X3YJ64_9GAMM|nr:DUF2339 domain-containing protein [Tahibacter soli]MDC8013341.1 DUF2339 domain-containing protein [Tahibacter soli]